MIAERKARSSLNLLPPSPPAEKATARQDQARLSGYAASRVREVLTKTNTREAS
jgi:hypothetical protein